MKPRNRNLTLIAVGVLLGIYISGYVYIRSNSYRNDGTDLGFFYMESTLYFGLKRADIVDYLNPLIEPGSPQDLDLQRRFRRQRVYCLVYLPAIWLNERLTGQKIDAGSFSD